MARMYTQQEVNEMPWSKAEKLFQTGKIDDDMLQRKRDYDDEANWLAAEFIAEFLGGVWS